MNRRFAWITNGWPLVRKGHATQPAEQRKIGGSEAPRENGRWSYRFVRCECGFQQDTSCSEEAFTVLARHRRDCLDERRHVLVPMWAVSWPWYWGAPDASFGLEMVWRPIGTHSHSLPQCGWQEKSYLLFTDEHSAGGS